jgi:hypothetical protein
MTLTPKRRLYVSAGAGADPMAEGASVRPLRGGLLEIIALNQSWVPYRFSPKES